MGARAPSSFGNSAHSAAFACLTVKVSKITKEKHVLHFCLSRQKHAKTHVARLKQYRNPKEILGMEERKNSFCVPPHLISWRRHCFVHRVELNRQATNGVVQTALYVFLHN